ncbi:MAG: DUF362 domain-containing protein [Candidatus Bathyarchaeota archaeon]
MSLVSLVEIQGKQYKKAIIDSLQLIDYAFPHNARNIVIKPNLCYYWDYTTGCTSDPKFVGSLIDVLREQISSKVKISLVESDASAMKCKYAFKMLGYENLAQQYNVPLVNLCNEKSEKVTTKVGKTKVTLKVPQIITDADLRINVTKIKYAMEKIKVTCAMKNIFGCIPYPRKYRYHPILSEVIVVANKLMKFDLCLVDGDIAKGAETRKMGLTMASTDQVALDAVASKIAGVNPKSIRYLQLASREGLGKIDFTTKGIPWEYFAPKFPRKGIKEQFFSKAFEIVHKLHLERRLMLD